MNALKHALTRQFSIIQGIPGSGKTHMGLAIISTLLMNTDSQILIVSYTNHALDQFLAGILKYTDSIVRIGNQSKNELLDRFNIKQLCENSVTDKRVKTSLFKLKMAYSEAVQELSEFQNSSKNGAFKEYTKFQVRYIKNVCFFRWENNADALYAELKVSKRTDSVRANGFVFDRLTFVC